MIPDYEFSTSPELLCKMDIVDKERKKIRQKGYTKGRSKLESLAKLSDRYSFRVNQNYSDSFRYLYPRQSESFRTNQKNVLYLVWQKTLENQSDLIRLIPRINPNESEPIRSQFFNPNESELGFIETELLFRINPNESEVGMIRINLN